MVGDGDGGADEDAGKHDEGEAVRVLAWIAQVMRTRLATEDKTPAGKVEVEIEVQVGEMPPEKESIHHQGERQSLPVGLHGELLEFVFVVGHLVVTSIDQAPVAFT